MAAEPSRIAFNAEPMAFIVSEVRFLRESLAEVLAHAAGIHVCQI